MGILDLWNKGSKSNVEVIKQAMTENKDIFIKYRKYDGEISERRLSNIIYNNSFEEDGFHNAHIKGYCHIRREERTFKIDRIVSIKIV